MYETLIGNKNAEKWDKDTVNQILEQVLTRTKEGNTYLLIHAIKDLLTYDQYEYIKDKFKQEQTIFRTIKEIEQNTEQNLTLAMLEGRVKETASIFLLKCKYGYVDKQTIEHEHKGTIAINLNFADNQDNED